MEMKRICSGCRDGSDFEIPFAMAFQPIVDAASGLDSAETVRSP